MLSELLPLLSSVFNDWGAFAISFASMMPSWLVSSAWITGGSGGGGGGGRFPPGPFQSSGPFPRPWPNAAHVAAHRTREMILVRLKLFICFFMVMEGDGVAHLFFCYRLTSHPIVKQLSAGAGKIVKEV